MRMPAPETLDAVNELFAHSTAMGAYAMGIVCSLAWSQGKEPGRAVLVAASQCVTLEDAVDWHRLTTLMREARLVA